jgi:hypothetical protein
MVEIATVHPEFSFPEHIIRPNSLFLADVAMVSGM